MGRHARPNPTKLPSKLRRIRARYDLTQTTMLKHVSPRLGDEHRAIISQFESGARAPSLLEILAYARFASVPVETLIDDNYDLPSTFPSESATANFVAPRQLNAKSSTVDEGAKLPEPANKKAKNVEAEEKPAKTVKAQKDSKTKKKRSAKNKKSTKKKISD